MNLKIAPKEIVTIKKKGIDLEAFQEVRRNWSKEIKQIVLNQHDKSITNH
jgi:hypothetical protein